ncbi:MAG: C-terminal binding protein [Candidatus Accumulibacter sp.]|jgi:D-3-phosphoglycerate dehydrogenase|nr:C-terminal binding protein [Accumulibacter sp.]
MKIVMTDIGGFPGFDLETDIAQESGFEFACLNTREEEAIIEGARDADGLVVVYAQITEKVIASLDRCKIIVRTGIGYNNIDVEAATRKGIMIANVPDYCAGEVADHAMALLLSLARKVTFLTGQVRKGKWSFLEAKPIPRLSETTLGLYGCGNIAQGVARRAQAFDIAVVGFDPYLPDAAFDRSGIKRVGSLQELYAASDFISLHAPLTPETRHVIDRDALRRMKKTAVIVNTARGPLIDHDALLEALQQGVIAGAALDVTEEEPPVFPLPLAALDQVLITPHVAYYSESSEPELRAKAVREVIRTLTEGKPKFWVNAPKK